MLKISIIILSKNEEKYIDSTLRGVFNQNTGQECEVILIDSGSQDSTLGIAARYPVKILEIPAGEFSHGLTRNRGARLATGDIVVFLNADATPVDEYWLKGLIEDFNNDEKIAGIYSRILARPECNPLRGWEVLNENPGSKQIRYIKDFYGYQRMKPPEKRAFLSFNSISCAIRRDFLLQYPFKDLGFGEDLEWGKRIMENGYKIVFEPQSAVFHSHNFYFSFTGTFKKYFDDSRINNSLLNIWSWRNFPALILHIAYKILRDITHVLNLHKGVFYKAGWIFYSPVIRMAEFLGIIAGANSKYLPDRLCAAFSLANEIKTN